MATLYFKVSSDWQEVVRLRQECEKLESQLKKMDSRTAPAATKALETQLASTKQQMMGLVTEAAKAGAAMENDFKKKIYDASQTVNGFTEQIIAQRNVVKNVEANVKRLGESYRSALKNNPIGAQGKLSEYNEARKVLEEERAALFGLTQQQAEARLSVKRLRDEYALYKKEAGETVDATDKMSFSFGKVLGVIGGVSALKQLGSEIIRVRGEFESMEASIRVLLGDESDKLGDIMSQLKEYALISPLKTKDMAEALQMMMGFGLEAEESIRYLKAMGDISMGNTGHFKSLALAFSQMSAAGKLMGQDLNQMINAGFNPLMQISEQTGKSMSKLKDEMSKGAISAEMIQQAFIDATSEGGKFYGMAEEGAKTLNGQISMLEESIENAFNEIGQSSEGVIMSAIQGATSLIENYETVGKVLVGLVTTYGVYRTALMLATAATSKHTIAEIALTNARVLARKAQLLLNAAMTTNPYVAIATVITGLVATMWALSDSTSAAEKAQSRFNDEQEKMAQRESERKSQVESLIHVIQDETETELAKISAYEQLRKLSPAITSAYRLEELATLDLANAQKLLNKERDTNTYDTYVRNIEESTQRLRKLREENGKVVGMSPSTGIPITVNNDKAIAEEEAYLRQQRKALEDFSEKLMKTENETTQTTYREDYDKAREEWESAKKELSKIEADKDKYTSEQFEKSKKRVEATEEAYKNLGGLTGTALSRQQKEYDERVESQQKLQDELLGLIRENQEQETALMKEGAEKKLKQINDDYEAREAEIGKKERELAELNKKAGTTDVNADWLTRDQQDEIDRAHELSAKQRTKQVLEVYKAEFDAMRDNLAEYGNYQQQKLAIAQKYDERIAEAQTEGERRSLESERDSKLAGIETRQLKSEIDWSVAFGEFGGMFAEVIRPVFEQVKQYMRTDEFKNADHDSQQALVEAFQRMEESLGSVSKVSFKKLGSDIDAYRRSMERLRFAQDEYKEAYHELTEAQEAYKEALRTGTEAEQEAAMRAVNEAQTKADAASAAVNALQDSSDKAKTAISSTATTLKTSMDGVVSGLRQLASGSLRGAYDGLIELGKSAKNIAQLGKVGDAMGTISKGLENVPIVGWIASILDILKDGLTDFIPTIHDSATSAVTNIFDDVFSGDLFKQGFNNTLDSIEKTLNTFSFGLIDFNFNGSNAKEVQETIDRLTNRNESLQSSIEALNDTMKEARGSQSVQAAKQAEEYQEEVNRNYLDMAMAQAGYHGSHHSWNYYWEGFTREQIDKFSEQIGREWRGSLWDLSPEEMRKLKGNVDMWTRIQETGEGGYGERLTEKLDDYIEQAGKIAEINDSLAESLTGISFDSMYDSFIDNLMNMEYSAQDAADNIAEYFMRAMLSNKIGEMYYDKLEEWWKKFGKSMEDGVLSETERKSLMDEYMGYVNEAINLRDNLAAATGYDQIGSSASGQQATQGYQVTASQESVDVMNGRLTGIHMAVEEIRGQRALEASSIAELRGSISALTASSQGLRDISDEIRSILANSYLELQEIRENTGAVVKPIQQMQKDIEQVRRNTERL